MSYYGGCLGKVDTHNLLRMLGDAGLATAKESDFVDAEIVEVPPETLSIAASVDLLYDFGLDPQILGWVAAVHALSDVYASLARPLAGTVSLGVTHADLLNGSAARILSGVAGAFAASGAAFAGGHTVYSENTFASVSVVGTNPRMPRPQPAPERSYSLMLSKPLGSGIYIAAARNDLIGVAEFEEFASTMRSSNALAAASLSRVDLADVDGLGFVTDVSGFGLLGALSARVPPGWTAEVQASEVPLLSRTLSFIDDHGLVTSLGDANWLRAHGSEGVSLHNLPQSMQLAFTDPQTSGGLLAAVDDRLVSGLDEIGSSQWQCIGTLMTALEPTSPTVSVV